MNPEYFLYYLETILDASENPMADLEVFLNEHGDNIHEPFVWSQVLVTRDLDVVELFLEHGANPTWIEEGVNTPLELVISLNNRNNRIETITFRLVQLLLKYGADPSVRTTSSQEVVIPTVVYLAILNRSMKLSTLLLEKTHLGRAIFEDSDNPDEYYYNVLEELHHYQLLDSNVLDLCKLDRELCVRLFSTNLYYNAIRNLITSFQLVVKKLEINLNDDMIMEVIGLSKKNLKFLRNY